MPRRLLKLKHERTDLGFLSASLSEDGGREHELDAARGVAGQHRGVPRSPRRRLVAWR